LTYDIYVSMIRPEFLGWYTNLKYEREAFRLGSIWIEELRERMVVWVAVFLLLTSGLSLPLASFASGPAQPSIIVPAQAGFKGGHVVVDGAPSPLFVTQVYVVKPHSYSDERAPETRCNPNQITGQLIPAEVNGMCTRVKVVDFVFGPLQGSAGGCYLKVGLGAGETVVTPQPSSMVSSATPYVPRLWWDFFQRRSKFEIYVEILEVIKRSPMTPFEIAFYARLNHKRTKEYVEFLVRNGYLHPIVEDGKTLYALNKEGMGFLDRAKALFGGSRLIEVVNYSYQRDF
jgi:predicted transcriptional regulator